RTSPTTSGHREGASQSPASPAGSSWTRTHRSQIELSWRVSFRHVGSKLSLSRRSNVLNLLASAVVSARSKTASGDGWRIVLIQIVITRTISSLLEPGNPTNLQAACHDPAIPVGHRGRRLRTRQIYKRNSG